MFPTVKVSNYKFTITKVHLCNIIVFFYIELYFHFSGTCERFLLHGNKDEFISITTIHLTFSTAHSKELKYSVNEWVKNCETLEKCKISLLSSDWCNYLFLSKTSSLCTSVYSYRKGPPVRKPKMCMIVTKLSHLDCFHLKD